MVSEHYSDQITGSRQPSKKDICDPNHMYVTTKLPLLKVSHHIQICMMYERLMVDVMVFHLTAMSSEYIEYIRLKSIVSIPKTAVSLCKSLVEPPC